MELILIDKLNSEQRRDLYAIVSDEETMATVGDGQPWTAQTLDDRISYSENDAAISADARQYYYWGIASAAKIVGLVGLHPLPKSLIGSMIKLSNDYSAKMNAADHQLLIIVAKNARGHGYAKFGIQKVLEEQARIPNRAIWALTRETNINAIRALANANMTQAQSIITLRVGPAKKTSVRYVVFRGK